MLAPQSRFIVKRIAVYPDGSEHELSVQMYENEADAQQMVDALKAAGHRAAYRELPSATP
jgi:hypothetical protein